MIHRRDAVCPIHAILVTSDLHACHMLTAAMMRVPNSAKVDNGGQPKVAMIELILFMEINTKSRHLLSFDVLFNWNVYSHKLPLAQRSL